MADYRATNDQNRESPVRAPIDPPLVVPAPAEPTLADLLSGLTNDLNDLIRKEFQLARAETMESISKATRGIVLAASGGAVAYAGFIMLLIGIVILLGDILPLWVSAVAIGLLAIVVGLILVQSGRSTLKDVSIKPERTIETIKEDAQWAKEQLK
jgi:hypothetical protein